MMKANEPQMQIFKQIDEDLPVYLSIPKETGSLLNQRELLFNKYRDRLYINSYLKRSIVSFQGNKNQPFYRWLKYKEGFSKEFVFHCLKTFLNDDNKDEQMVLDPFAGSGTTVVTSALHGVKSIGMELLPIGPAVLRARINSGKVDPCVFEQEILRYENYASEKSGKSGYEFPHIIITEGAFPQQTDKAIGNYKAFVDTIEDKTIGELFWFAFLAILEDISYTRKDGQYLRWDGRAPRKIKSKFRKTGISDFVEAIVAKLHEIKTDLRVLEKIDSSLITYINGSCLNELPRLDEKSIDLVITSPPYCNRYDYTRTYALELAYFGYSDEDVKKLRQTLLSATVENKSKIEKLRDYYIRIGKEDVFESAISSFNGQQALQEVLDFLLDAKKEKALNNPKIYDMVENYFIEMALTIHCLGQCLKPEGYVIIVNDNVQYAGEEIPVDLILCNIAEDAGFTTEKIWVLPKGKGNSSQQMGYHGRTEIRKCVYVWKKDKL